MLVPRLKVLFHVKHDDAQDDLLARGSSILPDLTASQARLLLEYEVLLLERAIGAGLIAGSDAGRIRERHLLDCLRAAAVVRPTDRVAYDLGSGAGLPGIVVSIACPWLSVGLVEVRRRGVAFLELAVETLRLPNAEVVASRIEELPGQVDLCLARALAPLARAWGQASPLLRRGGRLVYFAGARAGGGPIPAGARAVEVGTSTLLESAGPLVIMAR